ncbi:MAG TPA: hypothetical protein VII07_03345 [Bradyrhizobium sp.]|jgi:hypothetical protein
MMRVVISAVAAVGLILVATSLLRSRPPSIALSTAAMPPLQELHTMAGVNTLPVQEIDDQSLVYPTGTKR